MSKILTDTLIELLRIESVTDKPNNLLRAIEYVKGYFTNESVYIRQYESKGKPSIVISTKDTKNFDLVFLGHVDVVPADYTDAFLPKVEDTKIYARGSSDMKGPVASMLVAFKRLIAEESDLNIALVITTDEEVGGFDGAGYVFGDLGYTAKYAFVPDGGDNWKVVENQKGVIHIQLDMKGQTAHASTPWLGKNAIDNLIELYQDLVAEFDKKISDKSVEQGWSTTISLSKFTAGSSINSVPGSASMALDIRYTLDFNFTEINELINSIVEKYEGASWKILVSGDSMHSPSEHKVVKTWADVVGEATAVEIEYINEHGSSDARFLTKNGTTVLISKPVCSPVHIEGEWIDLDDLELFTECTVKWAKKILPV